LEELGEDLRKEDVVRGVSTPGVGVEWGRAVVEGQMQVD
jgi:hypothetical protein